MRPISENTIDPTTEKLRASTTHAAEAARDFGEAAAAKARDMTDELSERSREIRHQVEFRICKRPLQTMAAVFAAGFALGIMVLTRCQCRRGSAQS